MISKLQASLAVAFMLVIFAHLLIAAVRPLLPALIVMAVLLGLYSVFFRRRW